MVSQVQTMTQSRSTDPCPCGGAERDKTCCNLDCLVKPRFFCGQLLTHTDLGALTAWTADKSRLARYRDGWGVVCGLEVWPDPAVPGGVLVGPGYAVGCCGDDIVVCEPTAKDLSSYCNLQDECVDPWTRPTTGEKTTPPTAKAGDASPSRTVTDLRQNAVAVDLLISYREEPSDPQTALATGGCAQIRACEYSRLRETFALTVRAAVDAAPTPSPSPSVISAYLDRPAQKGDGESTRRWLQERLRHSPLRAFHFVSDWVADASPNELSGPLVAQLLLWMALDDRLQTLACACGSCDANSAVPLARVWLYPTWVRARRGCRVLTIDARPPRRRLLQRDCPPPVAGPGCVDPREVFWQPLDAVRALLQDRGVEVQEKAYPLPDSNTDLETALREMDNQLSDGYTQAVCNRPVRLLYLEAADTPTGDARVIAVCPPEQPK